jgi:hypothetical protein
MNCDLSPKSSGNEKLTQRRKDAKKIPTTINYQLSTFHLCGFAPLREPLRFHQCEIGPFGTAISGISPAFQCGGGPLARSVVTIASKSAARSIIMMR